MNIARTGLLLAAMTGLFLAVGFLLGGRQGAVLALGVALATNLFAFWSSDRLALSMHRAQPVSQGSAPELHAMVAGLAHQAGLPMPKVYLIDSDQPNAFATGRSPQRAAVAVTTGIMRTLSREELAGVIAHELAHIKNRDTLTMTVAATFAGAIGFISQFGFFFGGNSENRPNPLVAILLMILAPLAAMLVQMAISRTREFSADRLGAEICGNPRWLASALQRIEQAARGTYIPTAERNPGTAHLFIVNPLHGGALAGLFRTHPPTEQRVAALMRLEGLRPVQGSRRGSVPTTARGGPWG